MTERTLDGGAIVVTAVVGTDQHEVTLVDPAHGAPAALKLRVQRYQAVMAGCRRM